jgi:hypothetical protein
MEGKRNTYKMLVGKHEQQKPLRRPKHRWEDNIEMELKRNKMARCGLDSSGSGYGPVTSSCEYYNEPLRSLKGGELI